MTSSFILNVFCQYKNLTIPEQSPFSQKIGQKDDNNRSVVTLSTLTILQMSFFCVWPTFPALEIFCETVTGNSVSLGKQSRQPQSVIMILHESTSWWGPLTLCLIWSFAVLCFLLCWVLFIVGRKMLGGVLCMSEKHSDCEVQLGRKIPK